MATGENTASAGERKRAFRRAYYAANREKEAARNKAYREANREKTRVVKAAYRQSHPEAVAAQAKRHREANPDVIAAQKSAYHRVHPEKQAARARAHYLANSERIKASKKAWHQANREKIKHQLIARKYGLSPDEYARLRLFQGDRCAVCDTPFAVRKPYVDHCHRTGTVRGLLCSRCNLMIGVISEDIKIARGVVRYLKRHAPS